MTLHPILGRYFSSNQLRNPVSRKRFEPERGTAVPLSWVVNDSLTKEPRHSEAF